MGEKHIECMRKRETEREVMQKNVFILADVCERERSDTKEFVAFD